MHVMPGEIKIWPGEAAPAGWMFCHGQELEITAHEPLYGVLGTRYGGDGITTFRLPDLRGRVPVGVGPGVYPGDVAGGSTASITATGTGSVTLTPAQIPVHTHTATFTATSGNTATANIAIPVDASYSTENMPGVNKILSKGLISSNPVKIYSTANASSTLRPFDATVTLPTVTGNVTVTEEARATQAVALAVAVPVSVSTVQPSLYVNYIIALAGQVVLY
jgi:microcystin-dependent protein